jgi:hypothetical protein
VKSFSLSSFNHLDYSVMPFDFDFKMDRNPDQDASLFNHPYSVARIFDSNQPTDWRTTWRDCSYQLPPLSYSVCFTHLRTYLDVNFEDESNLT